MGEVDPDGSRYRSTRATVHGQAFLAVESIGSHRGPRGPAVGRLRPADDAQRSLRRILGSSVALPLGQRGRAVDWRPVTQRFRAGPVKAAVALRAVQGYPAGMYMLG